MGNSNRSCPFFKETEIQVGILKEEKHMTKEQIIGALKAAAKPHEEYYIDDEV